MANIVDPDDGTKMKVNSTSKAGRVSETRPDGSVAWPDGIQTYSAVSSAFTPGATPQDIFTITGSASKTLEILRLWISTVQTTAGVNTWFLRRRSTANSGGTSAGVTIVNHDSPDPGATGTVLQYTANPTAGNLIGDVWGGRLTSPAPATAGIGGFVGVEVDFIRYYGRPIVLRGITDVLAWNFNGAALPAGLSVVAGVTWIER